MNLISVLVGMMLVLLAAGNNAWLEQRRRRRRSKQPPCHQRPCSVSKWSSWSVGCSVGCVQTRRRHKTVSESCGGGCPFNMHEERPCHGNCQNNKDNKQSSNTDNKQSNNTGLGIGGVMGVIFGVIGLFGCGGITFVIRKKYFNHPSSESASSQHSNESQPQPQPPSPFVMYNPHSNMIYGPNSLHSNAINGPNSLHSNAINGPNISLVINVRPCVPDPQGYQNLGFHKA